MEEEQAHNIKRIHTMATGDYYVIDPAWEGQHTLYISRPDEGQRWVFVSAYSTKTRFKDIFQILLICAALIGFAFLGFRSGYVSKSFLGIFTGLGVFAPIVMLLCNQKKVVMECDPWHLKINRRDVFKSIKCQWKPEEIAGFRFVESGLSVPATCTQAVHDLQLNLKNGQTVPLLNWQAHDNLSWIADGLSQVLGLDLATQQVTSPTPTASISSVPEKSPIEVIEDAIRALPKPAGLGFSTDIIEDEEEGSQLQVRCWPANWKLYKLFRPAAVLLFLLGLVVPVALIIILAEADKKNGTAPILPIIGVSLVTVMIILLGSFLWVAASELKRRKVVCSTDGHFIWLWSGSRWTEIDPKQLKHATVVPTQTMAYYIGLGITKRKWISFGKAYAIEMTTAENMMTLSELPFDLSECQWICDVLEDMKRGVE